MNPMANKFKKWLPAAFSLVLGLVTAWAVTRAFEAPEPPKLDLAPRPILAKKVGKSASKLTVTPEELEKLVSGWNAAWGDLPNMSMQDYWREHISAEGKELLCEATRAEIQLTAADSWLTFYFIEELQRDAPVAFKLLRSMLRTSSGHTSLSSVLPELAARWPAEIAEFLPELPNTSDWQTLEVTVFKTIATINLPAAEKLAKRLRKPELDALLTLQKLRSDPAGTMDELHAKSVSTSSFLLGIQTWQLIDAEACFHWLLEHPYLDNRKKHLAECLGILALTEPEKAIAKLPLLPSSIQVDTRSDIHQIWCVQAPTAFMQYLLSYPDGPAFNNVLHNVQKGIRMLQLPKELWLTLIAKAQKGRANSSLISALIHELAKEDAAAAWTLLEGPMGESDSSLQTTVLRTLLGDAAKPFAERFALFQQLTPAQQNAIADTMASHLSSEFSVKKSAQVLASIADPQLRSRMEQACYAIFASNSPYDTLKQLASQGITAKQKNLVISALSNLNDWRQGLEILPQLPPEFAKQAEAEILTSVDFGSFEGNIPTEIYTRATALLDMDTESETSEIDQSKQSEIASSLLPTLLEKDPQQATQLLEGIPVAETRNEAVTNFINRWQELDPDSAVGWIKKLPEGDLRLAAMTAWHQNATATQAEQIPKPPALEEEGEEEQALKEPTPAP